MKLQSAKDYINFGVKNGYFNLEEFEGLTDKELIKKAQYLADVGESIANSHE